MNFISHAFCALLLANVLCPIIYVFICIVTFLMCIERSSEPQSILEIAGKRSQLFDFKFLNDFRKYGYLINVIKFFFLRKMRIARLSDSFNDASEE